MNSVLHNNINNKKESLVIENQFKKEINLYLLENMWI